MNKNFKKQLNKSGTSLYKISKDTNISYTVLNEIKNDKKNINHIMSETVYKLSLYFKCDVSELLNDVEIVVGKKETSQRAYLIKLRKGSYYLCFDNKEIIMCKNNDINSHFIQDITNSYIRNVEREEYLDKWMIH